MPKLPGVDYLDAVRAIEQAGFRIVRHTMHIVMSKGQRILTIPRCNPVNTLAMGGIIKVGAHHRQVSRALVARGRRTTRSLRYWGPDQGQTTVSRPLSSWRLETVRVAAHETDMMPSAVTCITGQGRLAMAHCAYPLYGG